MPIHLPPASRRTFLGWAAATWFGGSCLVDEPGGDRWIFLADTHIPSDPKTKRGDVAMADNFQRVRADFLQRARQSSGVVLHGDAAYLKGLREDYALLAALLKPITDAGLAVHVTLGNHDNRDLFLERFPVKSPTQRPLLSHHVAVLEGRYANLFLLDTLEIVDGTPGLLGTAQLQWLAAALDARQEKPALVCMHHNPEFAKTAKTNGLKDTDALWKVLASRRQVKALTFGHTHHWSHREVDGIHCVNLPPTAYVFQNGDPNGWVELTLSTTGGRFKLHALDADHKANGRTLDLKWRA
jgi:3',5'-cyclic-AMP phosphodiesterase